MGYTKTFETKLVRTKHKITFREGLLGTRALDLMEMLKEVPDEARVDEVVDDENGNISIEFHEEKITD